MNSERIKLPKQWRHWCSLFGLKLHHKRGQASHQWFYLVGRGRVWRVNCHNMLQCGDTLEEFDRWALCTIAQSKTPTTKASFISTATELLRLARSGTIEEFETITI